MINTCSCLEIFDKNLCYGQTDRRTNEQTDKGKTVNPLLLRRGGGYNQDILSIWKTTTIIFFTLNQNFELMVILKKIIGITYTKSGNKRINIAIRG